MSPSPIQNTEGTQPNRWYLAYGSNLSSKTFRGWRGIRPLSQTNVIVPSLELTFDLPGIPYWEPCFANVRRRKDKDTSTKSQPALNGVAYLVTAHDFARIIATEGGGSSYQEVIVECRRLHNSDGEIGDSIGDVEAGAGTTIQDGQRQLLFASTLLAPDTKRRSTPMQPSERYINIIRAGAREHDMPTSYIAYLDSITYYRRTSLWQRIGASLFLVVWLPPVLVIFLLRKVSADSETGRLPKWLGVLTGAVSSVMWQTYGRVWKRIFGGGEVTANDSISSAKDREHGEKSTMAEGVPTDLSRLSSAHVGLYRPLLRTPH